MKEYFQARKQAKREEKIEYYSAIGLVIIIAVVGIILEVNWYVKIYG